MNKFAIAYNDKKWTYEVHAQGCAHLISKHLVQTATYEAATGRGAADEFEKGNEDCFAVLAPCAKK
jgi:hypothetical protein